MKRLEFRPPAHLTKQAFLNWLDRTAALLDIQVRSSYILVIHMVVNEEETCVENAT